MPCVVITPFGAPVEPDVKRIFATVELVTDEEAVSTAADGTVPSSAASGCSAEAVVVEDDQPGAQGLQGGSEPGGVLGVHRPRPDQFFDRPDPGRTPYCARRSRTDRRRGGFPRPVLRGLSGDGRWICPKGSSAPAAP